MNFRRQIRANEANGNIPPELEIGAGLSQRRKSGVYMLNSECRKKGDFGIE
jgi:hypothetical protein